MASSSNNEQGCDTRWFSKYEAVLDYLGKLEAKPDEITEFYEEHKNDGIAKLAPRENNFLKEYVKVMKPLANACLMMQSEKSIDWGYHCPLVEKTIKSLEAIENLTHCNPLKAAVLEGMAVRFKDFKCTRNLVATMLHPAFKYSYVASKFEDVHADDIVEKIVLDLDQTNADPPSTPQVSAQAHRHLSFFYDDEDLDPQDSQEDNRTLLGKYFLEGDKMLNVLLQPKYLKIKKLFIKYNTQLLSSASSERLFSLAKHIFTYLRINLTDENFEKMVILNSCTASFHK